MATIGPGSLQDNTQNATRDTGTPGNTAFAIVNPDGSQVGTASNPFAPPTDAMSFTVTYNSTTDVYEFYDGPGGTGTLLQTVTLTYSNPSKNVLIGGDVA